MRSHVVAIWPQLENSIDSFMFQKVEEKQARINDIFSGEWEVFNVEDVDPAEEKLALITDPIKKAQIYIEIEQRKLQRSIEMVKWEIGDIEKRKADIDEEINTLPNILWNIEKYKAFNWNYSEYINTMKKQAESIKGKAKRARENIEKRWINISADLVIKQKELEALTQEAKDIQDQYPAKVKQYEIDQLDSIAKRKPRKYYIDQINDITNKLQIFENVEQQAEFKKSLLSKK